MSTLNHIAQKWIRRFSSCPLVDEVTGYRQDYAYQLFYGRQDESYPAAYPSNFLGFYQSFDALQPAMAEQRLLEFLHFIGIELRAVMVRQHLDNYPADFSLLLQKCYYIFKTLAHYGNKINIRNPYQDIYNDLFFLLKIEAAESSSGAQLNLFTELELPDLYSRFSQLPAGYEKDASVQLLFERVEQSSQSFFITGKAGTGKSTFIHFFAQHTNKKVLMMAFTGIAAINAGGQTIHSFFRFPLKPLLPEDEEITVFKPNTEKYKIIQATDTFIIDEVSMLRSDILEAIDFSLRINGGNPQLPFGGKQLLLIGDIFQLPPVSDNSTVEALVFKEIYPGRYFFDAPAYKRISPAYVELKKVHRQQKDLDFVALLDKVRTCCLDAPALHCLNARYNPAYTPSSDEFVMHLTATNAVANAENSKRLAELPFTTFLFEAEVSGEFREDRYPTSKNLALKKQAQIVFVKNDLARRWVNGTIAKLDFLSQDRIEIRLQDGSIHQLQKETWENRKYKYDRNQRKIVSEVVGTFTQFPIKLAWAITIHKSQGLSFDKVIIDLGTGAFINGQAYTALSRCRTLQGITLKRPLRYEDIISDDRIIHFHETEQLLAALHLPGESPG